MGVRWSRISWTEKNELWQRWRRGETLDQIALALHRGSSSIYDYVGAEGGIAPRSRRRSRLALTTTEREEISRQLARGVSLRTIGRALRRAPSTISREVARNHGRADYRAAPADRRHGDERDVRNRVGWRRGQRCGGLWRRSWLCSGHPSKSRAGFAARFRAMLRCRCRTRRFIAVCLFRAVEC